MRKILFRAKQHFDGEWVYGLVTMISERGGWCMMRPTGGDRIIECELSTLGQYTGLTDKNGREIFEGDIVKGVAYSTDFIGYIVWIDAIAGFGVRYFNKHREPTAWENSSILKAIQRWKQPNEFQAEIIGNIFDNPELIGG